MLSKKTKYGIKALTFIARNQGDVPVQVGVIANHEQIPQKFLENILLTLRKSGLLGSKKGKHGGYYISKDPKDILMTEVMRVLEGPIADWGLEIEKNAIKVDNSQNYQTNIPGIFAIGDVNTYPEKLKLILCGFHEATLMCQAAYRIINPDKKYILKYTTVSGIDGFDGSRKESPKAVVQSIT